MRRETFETPGPTAVSVKVPACTIRFEARPAATTTEVTLEVLKGDPELERQATIELHERGDRHELRIEAPKRRFGIGQEDYAVTVAVPERSDVETRTGSADVRGHGRFGRVDSTTGSGEIEFDDVDGDLRAKSASGDISVRNVGASASVDTASGDVELGAVAAEGRLRSASGDVTVREAAAGMSIHTASGDQSIGSAAAGR